MLSAVLGILVGAPWGPLQRLDRHLEVSVHRTVLSHAAILDVGRVISHVGDPLVVTAISVLVAALLLARGRTRAAVYVLVVRLSATLVSSAVKAIVGRPRPVLGHPFLHASGGSFPSGHALGSAALWGSIAVITAGRLSRAGAVAVAVVVPVLVAASRVLLGAHYVTDVVAGLALGWALALVLADVIRPEVGASPSMAADRNVTAG